LEALVRAGAFDIFDTNRAAHLAELPTALRIAEQHGKMAATGQNDLFGLAVSEESAVDDSQTYTTVVEPWSAKDRFEAEKTVLGLYLTGHPIDHYAPILKGLGLKSLNSWMSDLEKARSYGVKAKIAGLAIDIGVKQNKQGKNRGVAILDDNTARVEITAYNEAFDTHQALFAKEYKDTLLVAEGTLAMDEYLNAPRLKIEKLWTFDQVRENAASQLILKWQTNLPTELAAVLTPYKGGRCSVLINYCSNDARAVIELGVAWNIRLCEDLSISLKTLGVEFDIKYR
jgi:DNA polymerase-3 subunit alpha